MTDDDNDKTVLMGSSFGLDSFVFENDASGQVDVKFALGEDQGLTGFLRNFPTDLEFTDVGGSIDGVAFDSDNEGTKAAGYVFVTRRL